jgi:hypothetical protein
MRCKNNSITSAWRSWVGVSPPWKIAFIELKTLEGLLKMSVFS